jgi:glucose-6-phosphate dehydrogenase assembly protein OpcA
MATAQVSASCPVQKKHGGTFDICCEYITLRGTKAALERVGDLVSSLIARGFTSFCLVEGDREPRATDFPKFGPLQECIIVDSSYFSDAEAELRIAEDLNPIVV